MSRRRYGRMPTAEERALWDEVSARLRRKTETAPPPARDARDDPPPAAIADNASAPGPRAVLRPVGRARPPITLPAASAPAPSGLDRATETRLRKGRRAPDARLDLHGMTAARAHVVLAAFIERSRAAGHRCVLVITGKGGPEDGRPGVLRRDAPLWLSTPPLSEMIVNVSPAHPRHGGGGALYVYLRKRRR